MPQLNEQLTNQQLIQKAIEAAKHSSAPLGVEIGEVGAALVTDKGNVYIGVSLFGPCNIGFCSETGAIMAMLAAGETRIVKIAAADEAGPGPACGRCRELMYQINPENLETEVIITENRSEKLSSLLPNRWQEV